ncbi:MAG: two-CW domain-containing protein [Candidatus Aminicenantales bacterium]
MKRKNCWEAKECGRQPGGKNAEKFSICPAALPNEYFDGLNKGEHCGRFCWAVAGTLCGGTVQGTYAKKLIACLSCEFLGRVNEDEGREFVLTPKEAKKKS